jgi:acetyltransferase-like isoleucine patch superfamily enzyme
MSESRLHFAWRKWQETRGRWHQERQLRERFPTLSMEPGVDVVSLDRLALGKRVSIHRGAVLHCGGLDWSGGEGSIRIGDDSVISAYCVLFGAGGIDIGSGLDCGPGTMIFSSRSDYEANRTGQLPRGHVFAPVKIGDAVTLFAGCVIGPGVTIGHGATIGAGSVVLGDVEPGALYAGAPAVKVRDAPGA